MSFFSKHESLTQKQHGAEWNSYAQSFIQAILLYCWTHNLKTRDILHLSIFSPPEQLGEVLANSPASFLIAPGGEKMFASVRAIVSSHLQKRLDQQ